jgi:xanthine dehydrogenase large subunit
MARGQAGESPLHLSGPQLVTGQARFICDEPAPAGMLFAVAVQSPHARARIIGTDTAEARSLPGVAAVLTAADIPGHNQIGGMIADEPMLAEGEVQYIGQPVALVVAADADTATRAAGLVRVEYEPLPPVFTIAEALSHGSLYAPERRIERGDVDAALAAAPHRLDGVIETNAQEHLYLETQRCRAVPGEDSEITLYPSTQSPSEVQEMAARVLGLQSKDVTVDVRRIGGGFGGKENSATLWACLAAFACYHTHRPVEARLSRQQDLAYTGKRHPFACRYRAGFDSSGRILAYSVEFDINGGAFADLSMAILERAMLHADNCYHIPNARIIGRACRTNLPPNTAMRGFGAPQAIFTIESVIERIGRELGLDPFTVRSRNAYKPGQTAPYGQPVPEPCTPELLERLRTAAGYEALRQEADRFNRQHRSRHRGIGIVPVKFGVSFTASFRNQGAALVWVYADGSVSVSHGGVEMGQEVNTKVAQVVATEFGIDISRVRVETNNTKRVGNSSPTAASTGADINGNAALNACRIIKPRLAEYAAGLLAESAGTTPEPGQVTFADNAFFDRRRPDVRVAFSELAHLAYRARVNLGAQGFYRTPGVEFDRDKGQGTPFAYFAYGCCLCVAEVDLLTGTSHLLKAHVIHETGRSLNPGIDRGQICGAFLQGYGWLAMEELVLQDGRYLTDSLSTYKIPTIRDLPRDFTIEVVERDRQHSSVLGSKAIGEPPFIYGIAGFFAIADAVRAANPDAELAPPATPEHVLAALGRIA